MELIVRVVGVERTGYAESSLHQGKSWWSDDSAGPSHKKNENYKQAGQFILNMRVGRYEIKNGELISYIKK